MSAPKPTAPECIAEALAPYLPVIHDESTLLGAAQAVWDALLAEGTLIEGPQPYYVRRANTALCIDVLRPAVPLERDEQDA